MPGYKQSSKYRPKRKKVFAGVSKQNKLRHTENL